MQYISSVANNAIKYARLLKGQPRYRRLHNTCIAEGLRLCGDAAAAGRIKVAYCTEEFINANPGFNGDFELVCISREVAKTLCDTANPQGVFCLCDTEGLLREARQLGPGRYLLAENIADPGNLGTMLRTAEAFGGDGVILCGGCDPTAPKVIRASMGGIFRLPLYEAEPGAAAAAALASGGITCYAAVIDADAERVENVKPEGSFALAIGNEANGITPELAAAGRRVTIGMSGGAESLNAASAASILLWELFGRQK